MTTAGILILGIITITALTIPAVWAHHHHKDNRKQDH